MVFKRSEYGLQYKKSHLVKNIPEYYNHVAYRKHRRELEHAHTPLSWDFESDSKTSTEEEICDVPLQNLQIKDECANEQKDNLKPGDLIQQAKEKLQKYDSKDNQNVSDDKKAVSKVTDDLKSKYDKKVDVESDEKDDKKVDIKSDEKDDVQKKGDNKEESKGDEKEVGEKDLKLNLKENQNKKRVKKLKSKSPERPKSSPVYRPPFMAYGCGDKERETGSKRSFNVRASAEVYPAAMKALIDLNERQRRRENARRCLSARERKRKALILEKEAKEVAGWQSEYRRMYPLYKTQEYARSASRVQERPRGFKPYKF